MRSTKDLDYSRRSFTRNSADKLQLEHLDTVRLNQDLEPHHAELAN